MRVATYLIALAAAGVLVGMVLGYDRKFTGWVASFLNTEDDLQEVEDYANWGYRADRLEDDDD